MIRYIRGELISIEEGYVVVDVGGVGYGIYMSAPSISLLGRIGDEVRIHTYLNVKEDAMQLYGFLTKDDLNVFKLLIGVSGIGPRGGLAILSVLSPDDLRFAVLANDVKAIAAAPGIGKKTAGKVILELKDKLSMEDAVDHAAAKEEASARPGGYMQGIQSEAVQALVALGYGSTESMRAVKKVEMTGDMDVEGLLKLALKNIML